MQRRSPVEDFNLYNVEGPTGKFLIYEGSSPQSGGKDGQRVSVKLDSQAILVRTENGGRILMKRSSDTWPQYLEVTGHCIDANDCSVLEIAAQMMPK